MRPPHSDAWSPALGWPRRRETQHILRGVQSKDLLLRSSTNNDTSRPRAPVLAQLVDWHSTLRQRVNTVTNVVFLATGVHILALGVSDAQHCSWSLAPRSDAASVLLASTAAQAHGVPRVSELQRYWLFSLLFGGAQVCVFVGSAFFHASWTRAGQHADMSAVYAVLILPICHMAHRLGMFGPVPTPTSQLSFLSISLALCAAAARLKWRLHSSTAVPCLGIALAALILLWIACGTPVATRRPGAGGPTSSWRAFWIGPQPRQRPRNLAWSLGAASVIAISAAFGATWVDMNLPGMCNPTGWWQWHSVWHLCAAASLWCLYAFFRSEEPVMGDGVSPEW